MAVLTVYIPIVSYASAAILDSVSLAVRKVSVVDACRCQSQIFNLTAATTRLSDGMAFATLCFIRNLSDGPASTLVPAASNSLIGINRKHRRFARAPSQQTESGCTSTNLTDGLRDRSTTSQFFCSTLVAGRKPQRLSQATTNPADRQFTDRSVVGAQGNGTTHD